MVDENIINIVREAMQGSPEAFSKLVEVFTPMLRSIARCYLNEYFDIEDVLQDVWIKIYTNLDTLREPEKFKSWIAKIMRYHCIKACKTQRAIHGR
ncbi:RNA polymerase sigma factor, sigma-70 family [Caldanaerobius fijiensis DSM 17918]|uniref:RNA polymerase sigma factor, sigma-70 family n=1 Tax=Caldanaerobius fijiensis DSM 17918 TaxID=1121256 RepID=A0A1M4YJX4_9THEO|nr:sigma-70 family RNA polymerase sigma factor [Caldanaerobius fijiensis]SHF06041.1 RNA polymerase sigma factor, sigma-70 family [Caldanaerobius fijiensis DSM 17918]